MAGYIPDDIVSRIKLESDIVAVISEFVSLKKSGKSYKGVCPFHQEKTPSFFVTPDKEMYYCFGCQKGGNVVNFVMDYERLDYPSALRLLADKAGIVIPETSAPKSDYEEVYNSLSFAAQFYSKQLFGTIKGKKALDYLHSRDMDDEAIKEFSIGYAPDLWDGLLKSAQGQKIQATVLEKAGLVAKKQGYYDRFRNRIIIPINNISGKPVAFGARIMPDEEGPKYINSPETQIYHKGRLLFGFDKTKTYIREKNEAIIVEGYFDLISLYQRGVNNVVAVSGTGFTDEQASLLKRFCDNTILLYDSDSAGVKAAYRACGVLYNAGLEPKILRLPKGNDPDSFIREHGAEKLSDYMSNAKDVVEFVHYSLDGKFGDQTISRQKRIISALSETVSLIHDDLMRNLLKKKISDKFEIPENSIVVEPQSNSKPQVNQSGSPSKLKDQFEKSFLALVIAHPELLSRSMNIIKSDMFEDPDSAAIFNILDELYKEYKDITPSKIFDKIENNALRSKLSSIIFSDTSPADWEGLFEEYLRKFNNILNKRKLEDLKNQIAKAEINSDFNKIESLTREYQNLKSEVQSNGT
jgi:DNA primase